MPALPPRFLYRLFPLAAAASAWIEQRFSGAGRLLLGLFIASAVLGVDISQTLGYQVAALAFALLATSILLSWRWQPALRVRRILPQVVTAAQPSTYWLEITNLGTRIERDLLVHDTLRNPRLGYAEFQASRDRVGRSRTNWFDHAIGFPRWVALRRYGRGADSEMQRVPTIAPAATVRVRIETMVGRRGWLQFETIDVLRPDPLGLFRARHSLRASAALLALPQRHAIPQLQLQSERRYQRGGISLAMAVGDAQEFASLRDYRAGDARRHIHWRSFAKTGKLIVKEYQDEYFDRHALVVDTQLPAADHALFEAVITVAASVAGGQRPRDSILDLIIAGTDMLELSAGRGLGDALHALTYLAEAQATGDTDFTAVTALLRQRIGRLASVILVLGRWDAPRRALVEELARRGLPSASLRLNPDAAADVTPLTLGRHRAFTIRVAHLAADLARVELAP